MKDLYRAADSKPLTIRSEPKWIEVQRCTFSTSSNADKDLEQMIQLMAQATVRLPIVRKATTTGKYEFGWTTKGEEVEIKKGETVILDLVSSSN